MTIIENELPPALTTYRALYLEYRSLLEREQKTYLPEFAFWMICRDIPSDGGDNLRKYLIKTTWLYEQVMLEVDRNNNKS